MIVSYRIGLPPSKSSVLHLFIPSCPQPFDLFAVSTVLPFSECHVVGLTQCVAVLDGLPSLSHVVLPCLFVAWWLVNPFSKECLIRASPKYNLMIPCTSYIVPVYIVFGQHCKIWEAIRSTSENRYSLIFIEPFWLLFLLDRDEHVISTIIACSGLSFSWGGGMASWHVEVTWLRLCGPLDCVTICSVLPSSVALSQSSVIGCLSSGSVF